MKASVIGRVRNTSLGTKKAYLPLFEAVSNSLHATEDIVHTSDAYIKIEFTREKMLDQNEVSNFETIKITDNGSGFNDVNFDSFNTVDTQLKEKLGGKGLGRFIWLKAFQRVIVTSHYLVDGKMMERRFVFSLTDAEIISNPVLSAVESPFTTVELAGFKQPYKSFFSNDLERVASNTIKHFLPQILNPTVPRILLTDGTEEILLNDFLKQNISAGVEEKEFTVNGEKLTFKGFKFHKTAGDSHQIQYVAHNREVVSEGLTNYLPDLNADVTDENNNKFSYLALVEGSILDESVNNERTNFNFVGPTEETETSSTDLFDEEISLAKIRKHALELVADDLQPYLGEITERKKDKINRYIDEEAPQYRPLRVCVDEFIDSIDPNSSTQEIEMALHQQMYFKDIELKREGRNILEKLDPSQNVEEKLTQFQDFFGRYSEFTESRLASYVIHRKFILDLFERALKLDKETQQYPLESTIHNVIFPQHKTSNEVHYENQNLWIVDERLTYHQFLGSDVTLKSIESVNSTSEKRPDIIVFNNPLTFSEGLEPLTSVAVIEFKRAGRKDFQEDPLSQVYDVIEEIQAGKGSDGEGRPLMMTEKKLPSYAYIICDLTPSLIKKISKLGATPTPDNQGYFGFNPNYKLYFEIISYNKLLSDAKKRNRVLFDKLSIPANISTDF